MQQGTKVCAPTELVLRLLHLQSLKRWKSSSKVISTLLSWSHLCDKEDIVFKSVKGNLSRKG